MKHGSLFSGIGGFDLAAEWMGWENIFHCEWNKFGQKVLKHYWPKAISYEDITKTDFSIHRGQIDILTGGFPCQPYSQAGKRLGKEDDRHLWPEMLRAIREIAPTYVVGENVRGLVNWSGGLVFEEVCAELEAEGYEVQPMLLPACAVNAPHRRDRIWFVAYSEHNRYNTIRRKEKKENGIQGEVWKTMDSWKPYGTNISWTTPDTEGERGKRLQSKQRKISQQKQREFGGSNTQNATPDTDSGRQPSQEHRETQSGWITKKSIPSDWQNFPTQSPIRDGDDGISERLGGITFPKWRNESIKAGGNAIVPQVAYQIFKAIEEIEKNRI